MESRRPAKKYGGDMYDGRSPYLKSKELPVNSDEDDLHDSLSDKGLSVSFVTIMLLNTLTGCIWYTCWAYKYLQHCTITAIGMLAVNR